MRARRAGFTLIELLVVVIIIGILATITITRFWSVRGRAHIAAAQQDLRNLSSLQESYFETNFVYAGTVGSLPSFTASEGVTLTITYAGIDGWAGTATHAAAAGRQCGVYHAGAPAALGAPATTRGVVTCD
jgi:prepilin-type N-terminal cleavage/methylation domain-containing protein